MSIRKSVADLRVDYTKGSLDEHEVAAHPIDQFERWFEQAVSSEVAEANAMSLGTIKDGKPSVRIVLLKGFDEQGFVFYTNYGSHKGEELAATPAAALTFFWPELQRQVRIEGDVEKVSAAESDEYFASRDRGSRIGAWASPQSSVISSRQVLEDKVAETTARFEGMEIIPRPDHWGGYRIKPTFVEFWQGRASRLHDRIVYEWKDNRWEISRWAP